MNTFPDYDAQRRAPTQFESSKFLRFLFTGVFVTAVFIVPSVTAVKFFIA